MILERQSILCEEGLCLGLEKPHTPQRRLLKCHLCSNYEISCRPHRPDKTAQTFYPGCSWPLILARGLRTCSIEIVQFNLNCQQVLR